MRKTLIILTMLLLFTLQVVYANNPYEAIDPYTLPLFTGKLTDPGVKEVYVGEGYVYVEIDGKLFVYFLN